MAKTALDAVTDRLFEAFTASLPNPVGKKGLLPEAVVRKATDSGLARFYEAARQERERNRLGLIGRARVAFKLQQRLLAAGYPSDLVKQVLFAMLVSAFAGR